jgi:hypothetical protein
VELALRRERGHALALHLGLGHALLIFGGGFLGFRIDCTDEEINYQRLQRSVF